MKTCRMCGKAKTLAEFTGKSSEPDGHSRECRQCQKEYRENRAKLKASGAVTPRASVARHPATPKPAPIANLKAHIVADLKVSDEAGAFIQSPEVLSTFVAVQRIAKDGGIAPNLLFKGPSGCGKTESARDLARRSDLPFIKVDASAIVDPEAWFGTREVVIEHGAPKTVYVPSAFVEALEQPCLLLIDEINRVADAVRNILIPLFDDTRQVTNPLTGQIVTRHPLCFIVMTGNVGLAFTGTYAIDPALLTRALTTNFSYLGEADERKVVAARTGVDEETARILVRFANDTRMKNKADEDFLPVSTREILAAAYLIAQGLDMTTAVRQSVINAASEEGGAESQRAQLEYLWKGIVPAATVNPTEANDPSAGY